MEAIGLPIKAANFVLDLGFSKSGDKFLSSEYRRDRDRLCDLQTYRLVLPCRAVNVIPAIIPGEQAYPMGVQSSKIRERYKLKAVKPRQIFVTSSAQTTSSIRYRLPTVIKAEDFAYISLGF